MLIHQPHVEDVIRQGKRKTNTVTNVQSLEEDFL